MTTTAIAEIALTESRSLRAQHSTRTDVLDRVKTLSLLPDGVHATTELVAGYYEVDADAIESTVRRNREELEANGYRVLRGEELRDFETANLTGSKRRAVALFDRRAILNVGQLLRDSEVARQVRTYLLDVEELAPVAVRDAAIGRAEQQMRVLRLADGLVDAAWLEAKTRHTIARALGEEPEVDPATRPLTVGEYLADRGVTGSALRSLSTTFSKRVKQLYRLRHDGAEPPTVERFIDGALRQVAGYTERDRPLMDAAWEQMSEGGR